VEQRCLDAFRLLDQVPGVEPFTDITRLAKAVHGALAAAATSENSTALPTEDTSSKDGTAADSPSFSSLIPLDNVFANDAMVLLNLLYAPRRSRLHSLAKTLSR
jgi:hypothetical protein